MENWTEIVISVKAEDADRAGDIAQMVVPYGIYTEDYSNLEAETLEIAHIDLIDEELLKKDREHAKIHIYISPEANPSEAIAFLRERYESEKIDNEILTDLCAEEDWINNWKKYYKPIEVGEKLLICPAWENPDIPAGRIPLILEPGVAFGTGTHETTRLCLAMLEEYVKPGCDFLDVGCGSGILSAAALLLGAGKAVGIDIDPLAVKTAVSNVSLNHSEERFTGICGNLTDKLSGKFGCVAANIVADVIIILLKDIKTFLLPDAVCVFSGIIDTREDDVRLALSNAGFIVTERREEKGWVALAAKL